MRDVELLEWVHLLTCLAIVVAGLTAVLVSFGAFFWTVWAWWLRGRDAISIGGLVLAVSSYLLAWGLLMSGEYLMKRWKP